MSGLVRSKVNGSITARNKYCLLEEIIMGKFEMAVNAYHLLNRLSDVYNISVINMKILNKSIPVLTFKKIDLRWMTDMFSIVICYSSRFVKIKLSCVLNFLTAQELFDQAIKLLGFQLHHLSSIQLFKFTVVTYKFRHELLHEPDQLHRTIRGGYLVLQ